MDNNIDLILQIRNGNEASFARMCEQYKGLMDSLSRKFSVMCANECDSYEDFRQEAQIAFYNAIIKYDIGNQKVTFGAFAKVCIRNKLISYVRKLNSKKRKKSEADVGVNSTQSLQETVVQRELGEKLISDADSLLSKYEKVIFKMYLKGQKAKEIAPKLGKSVKSINNAIYRIRLKLKKTVE